MLVLSRTIGQSVVLPEICTTLTILQVAGKKVRVGVEAPVALAVHRNETWEKIRDQTMIPPQMQDHRTDRIEVLWLNRCRPKSPSVEQINSGRVRFKLVHFQDDCIHELTQSRPDLLALDLSAVDSSYAVLDYMGQLRYLACVPVILIGKVRVARGRTRSWPPIVDSLTRPLDCEQLAKGVLALFAYREWRAAATIHESHSSVSCELI
jgi:carbon storage regulator